MRSVVLSVYGAVTQNMRRIIYYGIVGQDLYLPLKELALLLLYCYWSTKKAGAYSLVSSFVYHCWRIHIYQTPAKLSIYLTASSLVGWVGNFAWEHRQYFGSGFCSFLLSWIKWRPLILVSFQSWKNFFLKKFNLLKLFIISAFLLIISALLLLKLEFKCT